jgi:hypothetical protein
MRSVVAAMAAAMVLNGAAQAQTATPGGIAPKLYIEGNVQSAFGNVTSQSFGAEVGVTLSPKLRVFLEAGLARDTAPETLGQDAQIIAGYLTQVQSSTVAFSVKQPMGFGLAGVRYVIPYDEDFEPYVVVGGGLARIEHDVRFSIGGTDVTDTIGTYGVALGKDLAGAIFKPMASAGAGIVWYAGDKLFFDLQYRFGRIFTDGGGTNLSRAGLGIGVRF